MRFVLAVLRPFIRLFCRLVFRAEFHGVENIPSEGPCLITPNHVTYVDPIWITIPVRRRIYYMAWDKPFEIPVLGLLMRVFGAFPLNVEAVDKSAYRAAIDLLRGGRALVIFPEGGRTKSGHIEDFKVGAFRLALTHGAPVVPVTICGANKIWPVGKMLPRPGKLKIIYHPPIEVERVTRDITRLELRKQARQLARQTKEVVASALARERMKDEG
jgi:1-acyl-sn-glycerol-3-phosphate acyltransferase